MKNLFYFFSLNLRKVMKEIGNLFCSLEDVFAHFLDKKKKKKNYLLLPETYCELSVLL